MKILTFTTLYPNAVQPHLGIFVENRLRHLVSRGSVQTQVVAPIPWFPFRMKAFGRYGKFASAPVKEERFGIDILHPRYPVIPKVGMSVAPYLMYASMRPVVRRIIESGYDFDLIDAHYFYPDGVVSVMLGKHFGKPVAITARGTDINLIPQYFLPRRMIRWAGDNAAALITVSEALKIELARLGVPPTRINVLRNGVDLQLFAPLDGDVAGRRVQRDGSVILSVGSLTPEKGHDLVIQSLLQIPEVTLVIVGEGPNEASLKSLVCSLELGSRVRFLGAVTHERMPEIYNAADAVVLASAREGLPNVLLEAIACATPVAATDVGGVPEIIASPAAGILIPNHTPDAIALAVRTLLAAPPSPTETRAYAERFSWDETTRGQVELFLDILEHRNRR